MATKQNQSTVRAWYAVLESDGQPVMLEGRPAIFQTPVEADHAKNRTSRPARTTVQRITITPHDAGLRPDPSVIPVASGAAIKAARDHMRSSGLRRSRPQAEN